VACQADLRTAAGGACALANNMNAYYGRASARTGALAI